MKYEDIADVMQGTDNGNEVVCLVIQVGASCERPKSGSSGGSKKEEQNTPCNLVPLALWLERHHFGATACLLAQTYPEQKSRE